jgi:hypothetical protein
MARRNLGQDAALDDFVSDFASGPLRDGTASLWGGFTGEGDDLTALLSRDLDRSPGARDIAEPLVERELSERNGRKGEPAIAPAANGIDLKVERAGNLGVMLALSSGEDDAGAKGELLGEGAATQQRLKRVAHLRRQLDDGRFWTSHDTNSHGERTADRCLYSTAIIEPKCTSPPLPEPTLVINVMPEGASLHTMVIEVDKNQF